MGGARAALGAWVRGDDWDRLAEDYVSIRRESRFLTVFPFLLDRLKSIQPSRLVDIGCGDGAFAEACALRLHGVAVDAYDTSREMTRFASSRASRGSFRVIPTGIALQRAAYDAATLIAVWMNWSTDEECVEQLVEARTMLTPAGRLLAAVTHPCFRAVDFSTFSTDFSVAQYFNNGSPFSVTVGEAGHGVVLENTHWNLAAMTSQLRRAGFLLEQLHELPDATELGSCGPGSPWLILEALVR